MYVQNLSLTSFRNYQQADVALTSGVTVFVGANGQGKTNLVEAVEYVSTLGSHRVANDTPLVKSGAAQAVVRAKVIAGVDDPRAMHVELEINPNAANRARVNKVVTPLRELPAVLRTVLFAPDNLEIVKGGPANRRDFIDTLLSARWPRFIGVRSDLAKVMKQRNALLKQIAQSGGRLDELTASSLEVWDERLLSFAAQLLAARVTTLNDLAPHLAAAYASISPAAEVATVKYVATAAVEPDFDPTEVTAWGSALGIALQNRRNEELRAGMTLVGPHRDEIELRIGEFPAKGYASHGESWSLSLALKLAAYHLLRDEGVNPVLILDDVFAELDELRRCRLANLVADAEQVLITAAVDDDVPEMLRGTRFRVEAGIVTPVAA